MTTSVTSFDISGAVLVRFCRRDKGEGRRGGALVQV